MEDLGSKPVTVHLRLSPAINEYLRIHAFARKVSINRLASDIIATWLRMATPSSIEDPRFDPARVGASLPPLRTGPTDYYYRSIGYDESEDTYGKD